MKKLLKTRLFYPALLTLIFIILLLLTVPFGSIYGSEGDWFSQHAALAEQFRQIFYETGRILPDYTLLGAGSNIYDISYYGLLRPDVLFSFLLPHVSIKYIISAYAVLNMIAAVNLCYIWLTHHVSSRFFAFFGALLFSCGGFTWQAHHQIMFVNYLPFLFLALLGIDRLLSQRKSALLTFSLFLLYLHSYYFTVSALFVCLLYFMYCFSLSQKPWKSRTFAAQFTAFAGSVLLSVAMASVLLIPTALDILSNRKDAGTPPAPADILAADFSMNSLLYSGYSCGLTLLCLYTLLLSIRRKSTRLLGIILLLCLIANCIPYVLSGFLYIRYKVLIPLVPFFLLLCVQTLEKLHRREEKHSLIAAVCCLLPSFFYEYPLAIRVDFLLMISALFLCHTTDRREKHTPLPYLLLACFPIMVFLTVNRHETYIRADDNRQSLISQDTLDGLTFDKNYRFNYLSEPFAAVNLSARGIGSTNLYSSVMNSGYADHYYNTVRNPIRIRNRVALMTDCNPIFSYLMGIRYIQTQPNHLPLGYQPITSPEDSADNNTIVAENPDVLPIAYTSTSLMDKADYNKLDFPYNLTALTNYTITNDCGRKDTAAGNSDRTCSSSGGITPLEQTWEDSYTISSAQGTSMTLPLTAVYRDKILIISFHVTASDGGEIAIDINGIRNKLSGRNAPYPNHNDRFTYILSDADGLQSLHIHASKGNYCLSDIQCFLVDPAYIGNDSITPLACNPNKGNAVLKGTAALDEAGYFVTSLPYRNGYTAYADGKKVTIENINEGFVGFPLDAGTHEITLRYSPPGKKFGMVISLAGILLFVITLRKEKRTKQ